MPQACYAQRYPLFQPAMRIVTAISQTNPAVVTTSFNHQYLDGLILRLDIPLANGMQQISGTTYQITVTGLDTFSVPVDARSFQAFTNNECTPCVPVGENNMNLDSATHNATPYSAT